MSNFDNDSDKLKAHLDELKRKHRALDEHIASEYNNKTTSTDVYRLKTQKLWLKDEIYRIETALAKPGHALNGSH